MFTCAKEKVTFVIKNTYRHCNWSASFEASKYLGGKPSHMSETFNERLVQKPSQRIRSRLQVVFWQISICFVSFHRNKPFAVLHDDFFYRRGIGILESGISVLFVESGILGFGKRNTAQGTLNPINDWTHEAIFTTKTRIHFFFSHI